MPRLKSGVQKERYNCELPLSVWDKANYLMDQLQFDSISEVIRTSISLYEDFFTNLERGERLVASNGGEVRIDMPQVPVGEEKKRYSGEISSGYNQRIQKQADIENTSKVKIICKAILLTHEANARMEEGRSLALFLLMASERI
jgi:hypothetical protein